MKRIFMIFMSMVLMVSLIPAFSLESVASSCGDLYYITSGRQVIITDCKSSATGEIVIPSKIDGLPVVAIAEGAFKNNTNLTSIIIPDSVTNIPRETFWGCTGLTNVFIPDSVTGISNSAFYNCSGLKSINIPSGITVLSSSVFSGCTSLNNISIPYGVRYIGDYAFSRCTSLTNINIPNSVTSIGMSVFSSCSSLESVSIPGSLKCISRGTFSHCTSLKNVTINYGVENISDCAFSDCIGLTSIVIPNSVTVISKDAFLRCSNLKSIVIPKSVRWIGDEYVSGSSRDAVGDCENLTIYGASGSFAHSYAKWWGIDFVSIVDISSLSYRVISDGVTAITSCDAAVTGKLFVPSDIEGNSVTAIGDAAFRDCTGITEITVPKGVTSVGSSSFEGCTELTSVTIENGVTSIASNAFSNCTNLAGIIIPTSVISIGEGAFSGCDNLTIYGISGSYAEIYAKENNIPFCEYVSDEDFKFSGASITLYDNLQVNFKVEKALLDKGFTDVYTTFTIDGKTTVVRDYTEDGDYYVFSCSNIRPDQINDKIVATLNGKCLGHTFSAQAEYSISDYCYRMLARCTGAEYAKLRTLLVDLLNYGAASQLYTGHNTASLANATLTGEQKAEATAQVELSTVQNLKAKEIDSPSVSWKGAGLNLKEAIVLRFKIAAESIDGLSVKVESGDGTWTIPSSMFEQTDGGYYVYFNKLNAGQLSDTVYLTVFNGATAVSNTISYSVESYAYAKQNTADEVFKNLLDTMMKYGKSAYEYTH